MSAPPDQSSFQRTKFSCFFILIDLKVQTDNQIASCHLGFDNCCLFLRNAK